MYNNFQKNLYQVIKELLPEIGLGGFEPEVVQGFDTLSNTKFTLYLKRNISIDMVDASKGDIKLIEKIIGPIFDEVRDSPISKSTYCVMEEELKQAKIRIKELEPFEQNFKVQMKLNHGEKT